MILQVADPIAKLPQLWGCKCSPSTVSSIYVVDYHILPSRLVRKRHRERQHKIVCCKSCFEAAEVLPVLIDGRSRPLHTRGEVMGHQSAACWLCSLPAFPTEGLYGVISSSLWSMSRCIKSVPLAFLCLNCVENKQVTLQTDM